jgi:hypothetical protein
MVQDAGTKSQSSSSWFCEWKATVDCSLPDGPDLLLAVHHSWCILFLTGDLQLAAGMLE